jgi:sigma-B regulation protein RsbU (phosphoserine phosphatase)
LNDEQRAQLKVNGEVVEPERPQVDLPPGSTSTRILKAPDTDARDAATVLVEHLFAAGDRDIPGVSYAVAYRLAEANSGGDIVDVYQFDNNAVALSIADISGKGIQAAVHAALIKYGLRAYSSHGLTPEKAMRAMDRLYLENSTFEHIESFASVFLGIVDPHRRVMTYASAGHEPVIVVHPHLDPHVLPPTAPIIGVFDDQHHLFRQEMIDLWPGSLLVATTDGATEVRNGSGEFFGIERLVDCIARNRDAEPNAIVDATIREISSFSSAWHDDVAILVARFA